MTTPTDLEHEIKKLRDRIKRRRQQNDADQELISKLEIEHHRLELKALIGVPDGVRYGYRLPAGDKDAWLSNTLGTLKKVNRARAKVDYGERGVWNIYLCNLKPAGKEQGWQLAFGT